MKLSLPSAAREPLNRQTAWGCFTTNLAVPGFGSLVAGRRVGYAQALFGLGGLGISLVSVARFAFWYVANFSRFRNPEGDSFEVFGELLRELRWPLIGFGLFAVAWIWALGTSLAILAAARNTTPPPSEPPIQVG